MVEPLVVRQARAFSAALLDAETKQFAEMGKRWMELEQALEAEMTALALEIEQMRLSGKALSAGQVKRMERLRTLLAQVREQTDRYAAYASDLGIARKIEIAADSWRAALEAVHGSDSPKLAALFNQLPVKTFETMAGLMADGSALRDYLKGVYGDAVDGMTSALLRAVAQGWNPVKTARSMRDGLGIGLDRALNVARTEQLRSMREATRLAYQESGVGYYKRLAAKSTRTCIACLLADGKIFPVDVPFQEHPEGRCSMVPVLDEMPEWETGLEWFLKENESIQREILGPGLFGCWKASGLGVEVLLKFHDDETWAGIGGLRELPNSLNSLRLDSRFASDYNIQQLNIDCSPQLCGAKPEISAWHSDCAGRFLFSGVMPKENEMFRDYLQRLMLDEGAAGGGTTGGDNNGQQAGGLVYETWIAGQPETVRAMLDGQTSKLKSALTSERERSKTLEKDLREAASKADKGSEAEKRLTQLADQVQTESKKSAFYESAVVAGVNNLKLAYLAATQDGLFTKDGAPDFDALKKSYPELFGATQSNGAGEGGNNGGNAANSMDDLIRGRVK